MKNGVRQGKGDREGTLQSVESIESTGRMSVSYWGCGRDERDKKRPSSGGHEDGGHHGVWRSLNLILGARRKGKT